MEKYERLKKIGSGSYGYVYKCRNRQTGEIVAIKKFLETEEDPTIKKITFREIRVLRDLHHPNIVNLVEVFRRKRKLHLVFEFCSSNLLDLMTRHPEGIPPLVARDILHQTLQALHYMHANLYVHRDIKPENILLQGSLVKVCDFGFARPINRPTPTQFEMKTLPSAYTDYVATRWYRAPELLVGEPLYGPVVDIWATGCVYAECMTGEPLWPGTTDLDQLFLIRKTLGEVPIRYMGFFSKNPFFSGASLGPLPEPLEPLAKKVAKIKGQAFDVLKLMVTKDGNKRPSAEALMAHPYFEELPYTVPLDQIKASKQKQMFAVFKACAAHEIAEALDFEYTSHDGSDAERERIRITLHPQYLCDSPSKHSTDGPLPPGVRELLQLRREEGCRVRSCEPHVFMQREPFDKMGILSEFDEDEEPP